MAEAYGLTEGLMLAQLIGANRLIIQSDCMELVAMMQEGGFYQLRQLQYMTNDSVWLGFDDISIEYVIGMQIQ